jgi:hypothetical protein
MDQETRERRRAAARHRVRRQRRLAVLTGAGAVLAAVLLFTLATAGGRAGRVRLHGAHRPAPAQLPGGGRVVLPGHLVVAYYGAPGTSTLGVLGSQSPRRVADRLVQQAAAYRAYGRAVLPAFELIATVATSSPGTDGMYRTRQSAAVVEQYLRAARAAHALLILDVQPGRSDFMREVQVYDRFLHEPDVSLALDPEWKLGPGQLPGQVIGSTDAATVNAVSAYLSGVVTQAQLPQKLLIVHQFVNDEIRLRPQVTSRPGLALTFNIDGFGDRPNKVSKYTLLTAGLPTLYHGFKLFYTQDVHLMSPGGVMRLFPRPDLIVYQ